MSEEKKVLIAAKRIDDPRITPEIVSDLREWLGEQGLAFFSEVLTKHGTLNAFWMEGSLPWPVHLRDGMQVRNQLRLLTNYSWSDQEYSDLWEECVLRALELKPTESREAWSQIAVEEETPEGPAGDPIAQVIYQTIRDWRSKKLPTTTSYGALSPGLATLLIELANRIKNLNLKSRELSVEGIVSSQSGEPFVRLCFGEMETLLAPETARRFARDVLEEAAQAEADSCLLAFHLMAGGSEENASRLLAAFREFRHEQSEMARLMKSEESS